MVKQVNIDYLIISVELTLLALPGSVWMDYILNRLPALLRMLTITPGPTSWSETAVLLGMATLTESGVVLFPVLVFWSKSWSDLFINKYESESMPQYCHLCIIWPGPSQSPSEFCKYTFSPRENSSLTLLLLLLNFYGLFLLIFLFCLSTLM